jgi:hypothetical protein
MNRLVPVFNSWKVRPPIPLPICRITLGGAAADSDATGTTLWCRAPSGQHIQVSWHLFGEAVAPEFLRYVLVAVKPHSPLPDAVPIADFTDASVSEGQMICKTDFRLPAACGPYSLYWMVTLDKWPILPPEFLSFGIPVLLGNVAICIE